MDHSIRAAELFCQGYNCAQAIAVAFSDVTGLEPAYAAKMASSFGGGIGRLREVCGAGSGRVLVAGILYGYESPDSALQKAHYELVQELVEEFRQQVGSIVCRDILKNPPTDPTPSPRTAEYSSQRPCARMVYTAAQVLDDYIAQHPIG